jgi:WD40 repeat protein
MVASSLLLTALLTGPLVGTPSLVYSADGKFLVVTDGSGSIRLHDVADPGKPPRKVDTESTKIDSVAVSADGRWLAIGDQAGHVELFDAAKKASVKRWLAGEKTISALAFHPREPWLVSGGADGTLAFWTLPDGKLLKRWKCSHYIACSLAFSADGATLFSSGTRYTLGYYSGCSYDAADSDDALVWDVATGKSAKSLQGSHLASSPDGRFLAVGGVIAQLTEGRASGILSIDDRTLVQPCHVRLLDRTQGKVLAEWKEQGNLVAISPNGKWLAMGVADADRYVGNQSLAPGDRSIQIRDATNGKLLLRLPQEDAVTFAFSPDSRFVAALDESSKPTVWDLDKEKRSPSFDRYQMFAATKDPLLLELARDYDTMLAKDPNAETIREARRWIYMGYPQYGVAELRKLRTRTALPLLLRAWLDLDASRLDWDTKRDLALSWTILTGRPIDLAKPARVSVEEMVDRWWRPAKDRISLDVGTFDLEQRRAVVRALRPPFTAGSDSSYPVTRLRENLDVLTRGESAYWRSWWPEDLHPSCWKLLLEEMGQGDSSPDREIRPIDWRQVAMTASLAAEGRDDDLVAGLDDAKESVPYRVACLWALTKARGKAPAASALKLYRDAKSLDHRLAIVLALRQAEGKEAGDALVGWLRDPNRNIRFAALVALPGPRPAEALPILRERMHAGATASENLAGDFCHRSMLRTLVEYRSPAATHVLADFLQASIEKEGTVSEYDAFAALCEAAGRALPNARETPDESMRVAREAIAEWRQRNPK